MNPQPFKSLAPWRICHSCGQKLGHQMPRRSFATNPTRLDSSNPPPPPSRTSTPTRLPDAFDRDASTSTRAPFTPSPPPTATPSLVGKPTRQQPALPTSLSGLVSTGQSASYGDMYKALNFGQGLSAPTPPSPFVLSIYTHRHNTHMALTGAFPPKQNEQDKRKAIMMSTGNIGFRKAQRGTFDAGFQLAAYVLGAITERGILPLIERAGLEVKFRGYGKGRDAVEKALLGIEGRRIRASIVRVTDATRLKFGGTRSPNPRRL